MVDKRCGQGNQQQTAHYRPPRLIRPCACFLLQLAFGFGNQPTGGQQCVHSGYGGHDAEGEQIVSHFGAKRGDKAAEHPALGERHASGTEHKGDVPQIFVIVVRFYPKIECRTAHNQGKQHKGNRQVKIAQNQGIGFGKSNKQYARAQHQPGFVGIPKGADRADHHILFIRFGARQQHAHA